MKGPLLTGNKTATREARGDDFYASPYAALPPLLMAEGKRLPKVIWESAAGNGALAIPLRNRGYKVFATDLRDWGCPDCEPEIDFTSALAEEYGASIARQHPQFGVVTNPPFGIIVPFIERAVAMAPYTAVLCRLAFLESEGRMRWFQQVGLRRVHLIADRLPTMHRHGYNGPKLSNAGMCFAWFVFERGRNPLRTVPIRWVSWKEACRKFPQADADLPPIAKDQLGLFAGAAA